MDRLRQKIWPTIFVSLSILILIGTFGKCSNPRLPLKQNKQHFKTTNWTVRDLLDAIEWQESSHNEHAYNPSENAIGILQIRPAYAKDARVLHHRCYNKMVAEYAFERYMARYATPERLGHQPTLEDMARIHNGGPNGWRIKATEKYWLKVKSHMETKPWKNAS